MLAKREIEKYNCINEIIILSSNGHSNVIFKVMTIPVLHGRSQKSRKVEKRLQFN